MHAKLNTQICNHPLLFKYSFTCFVYSMKDQAQHQYALSLSLLKINSACRYKIKKTFENYSSNGSQALLHISMNSLIPSQTTSYFILLSLAATRFLIEVSIQYLHLTSCPRCQIAPFRAAGFIELVTPFRLV